VKLFLQILQGLHGLGWLCSAGLFLDVLKSTVTRAPMGDALIGQVLFAVGAGAFFGLLILISFFAAISAPDILAHQRKRLMICTGVSAVYSGLYLLMVFTVPIH
jgi:hypothetical protein